jgi:hypothetical protein
MQLVLNDQVGGRKLLNGQWVASTWSAWAVKAIRIGTVDAPEELSDISCPGHRGELVHGCDHKAGQSPVNRLIHRQNREWLLAGERTASVYADDAQVFRKIRVRN